MAACQEPEPVASTPLLTGTVSIKGTAEVGETLTANTGSLGGSGAISYQWKRGTTAIGTNSGAYTVQTDDEDSNITVTVTRFGYSGSVTSAAVGPVTASTFTDPNLPALTGTVSITGYALVEEILTANTKLLGGSGTISYQWKRGTANIGANSGTYTVQTADVGSTITVTVTRSGNSGRVTSAPTDTVVLTGLRGNDAADFGVSAIITDTFNVGSAAEWNTALNAISSRGNGKNYIINITADFFITSVNSFGSVSGVKVSVRGPGRTLTLSSSGSILRAGSEQIVILRDVTLRGLASNSSSMVNVLGGGTFTMQSGKIVGNTASSTSGVYVSIAGTFNMNGGEISGNTSSGSTGSIVSVYQYGAFTMNGGKISGNTANGASGGVVVLSEGTLTMQGGEISGNTGRGVYAAANGTFAMYDGEISGNTGGGVNVASGGTFRLANGIIYGSNESDTSLRNTASTGAALSNSGTAQYGTFSGSTWNSSGTIYTTEYTIKMVNGVPYIGSTPANNYTFNVAAVTEWDNAHNAINTYDDFSYTINVTADFNVAGRTTPNFVRSGITVAIQGTGRTLGLSSNGSLIHTGNNQTVILRDLTLKGRTSNTASLVYVGGGTFTLESGAISGNTSPSSDLSGGGGVYVGSGTFTMSGGEISGNTASAYRYILSPSYTYHYTSFGGGVYVYSGTFTMSGGKISGNTASASASASDSSSNSSYGGGVYVCSGTFTMSGGEISGNTASASNSSSNSSYGGGVYVRYIGTFRITNGIIYGSNEADTSLRNIATTGRVLHGDNANGTEYGTFSGGTWNTGGTIYATDHTVKVVNGVPYIGSLPADNYTFNTATAADWDNAHNAIATYDNFSYTINVTADFDVAGHNAANFVRSGITITIQGTGRTLSLSSNGSIIGIRNDQAVILRGLTLRGNTSNGGSLVWVSGGTFTMESGKISGNCGGGVNMSSGTFNMNGGIISDNTYGAGSIDVGILIQAGGGVYVGGGIFTMNSGEISNNTTDTNGGGVWVGNATFTMNGGKISNNTANSDGGGVSMGSHSRPYNGTFNMNGGEISGNTANSDGGGVWVGGATFTMSGGVISGNTANYSGGGVDAGSGIFTKTGGGTINNNVVKNSSGVGHEVIAGIGIRETPAGPTVNLDSRVAGAAGGWEN
ncbi:MAG: hypothetical protein LBG95_03635 [Treponema sp.]|nr:hypothetical protein [Treponema sp.]